MSHVFRALRLRTRCVHKIWYFLSLSPCSLCSPATSLHLILRLAHCMVIFSIPRIAFHWQQRNCTAALTANFAVCSNFAPAHACSSISRLLNRSSSMPARLQVQRASRYGCFSACLRVWVTLNAKSCSSRIFTMFRQLFVCPPPNELGTVSSVLNHAVCLRCKRFRSFSP